MYAQDGIGIQNSSHGPVVVAREFDPVQLGYGTTLHTMLDNGSIGSSSNLGTPYTMFAQDVVNAPDGSAMIIGSVLSPEASGHDGLVVNLDPNGAVLWTSVIELPGSQQFTAGTMLPDGGVALCGFENTGDGHDVLVVRLNASGDLLWSHTETGPTEAEAHGITAEGGDLVITGRELTFSGNDDVLLMRMDLQGTMIWSHTFGGDGNDVGRSVASIGGSIFITAGWTDSFGTFDETTQHIPLHYYLIAFDLQGDTLWTTALGDTLHDRRGFDLVLGVDNDLLLAGERGTSALSDATLMRVTTGGVLVWERAIDTGKEERLSHILPLPDGSLCTGWSFGPFGRQVLFVRRDHNGF
ncbi:MAG: hypothetical protein JNM62_11560 [Flavobacteriales bacterium]|nr:hypothetical protein [Flavobacteriales bacterium]